MTSAAPDPARRSPADANPLAALLPAPLLRRVGGRYDRARFAALLDGAEALAPLIVALANATGGYVALGCEINAESGAPGAVPGISGEAAAEALAAALGRVDPPVEHLLTSERTVSPAGAELSLVSVRQSPSPPHLLVPDGAVLLSTAAGVRSVRSRAELDALYQRGRNERERAERQIDAMIEKLLQAHYAFYGVGVVACMQRATAEPYLWAREHADELISESDPFCAGWKLTPELMKTRPGEVDLRGEKEVFGYLRITRAGCVAVGEVRRRPAGNTVGTVEDVARRIDTMVSLACRILAQAPDATIVPRLFYEGMRGQRVVVSQDPYGESSALELDTAQFPGNMGTPADPAYPRRLSGELAASLLAGFKVEWDAGADALPQEA
ncbi:MAG TPA: hypothetical protein VKV26_19640 [Dehalococcoidia bacterium]|nr:hypothetical protein [Dehalococcoidia bacterium]